GASDIATFMPAKRYGSEFGNRNLMRICRGVARTDLKRSSASGSMDRSPSTVSTTIANTAMVKDTATFDVNPVPIQMMNSGANAILGMLLSATSKVYNVFSRMRE